MQYQIPNQNQKKNKKWIVAIVAALLSLLVIALAIFAGYSFLRAPLGEPLSLTPQKTTPTVVLAAAATATVPAPVLPTHTALPAPTALPTATAQPVQQGACGSSGALTILLTGSDTTGGVEPRGADAIRLVKVDFDHKKISVVTFPRDLWVNTPGLASLNIYQTRLGLAYFNMKEATSGTEKHRVTTATTLLAQTLYDNFAVEPQNYFTLEMKNLPDMINAVGGVEVDVPSSFVSDYRMAFVAGPQVMDGPRAYEYVRTYNPGGDAARVQRQNLFIKGLQERVINASILPRLPDLINQFEKMVYTDLTPQQLISLGCMAQEVPEDQIAFYQFGTDLARPGSVKGVLFPDAEKIRSKLQEWLTE